MQFTYYGHACFAAIVNGKTLLFDPFISYNELAKSVNIDKIAADYILVSHGHQDHVADVKRIAERTNAKIVSNFEIVSWFEQQGQKNTHPMNTGGKWTFDFGTVKCVVAQHSSVLPDGTNGGNPMGFIVDGGHGNSFYYAGDTALTMDMKLIPHFCPNLNIALLPIGDNFTMGMDDATLAAEFCGARKVIGLHYDTFGFIKIDHAQAKVTFGEKEIELLLPSIGETIEI
jgi:L-ascorbate metabolism protein UlaG (beta-lactamase superfamily)